MVTLSTLALLSLIAGIPAGLGFLAGHQTAKANAAQAALKAAQASK